MRLGFNSTIIRKEKVCKSCGKPCYPFSKGRCQPCATREDTMKRMEQHSEKIIVEDGLQDLIKDADAIFSKFIRLKYADKEGKVQCYTCPTVKHWTLMQNGHYIRRAHLFLRYDERNCKPQCVDCNEYKNGNIGAYLWKLETQTPGITDILLEESNLVYKPTRDEIRAIISDYTQKLNYYSTT